MCYYHLTIWVFHLLHSLLSAFILTCLYLCLCFIAAYCSPPSYPVNGSVHSLTGTKLGSTLRFSCDQGFRLIGQSSATCTRTPQGIYQWNAPVPLCQGKSETWAAVSWVKPVSFLLLGSIETDPPAPPQIAPQKHQLAYILLLWRYSAISFTSIKWWN